MMSTPAVAVGVGVGVGVDVGVGVAVGVGVSLGVGARFSACSMIGWVVFGLPACVFQSLGHGYQ